MPKVCHSPVCQFIPNVRLPFLKLIFCWRFFGALALLGVPLALFVKAIWQHLIDFVLPSILQKEKALYLGQFLSDLDVLYSFLVQNFEANPVARRNYESEQFFLVKKASFVFPGLNYQNPVNQIVPIASF